MSEVAVPRSMLIDQPSCPLCGGSAASFLTDTRDLHYGIAGIWSYDRCNTCRLVYLNPAPSEEFLSSAYDDSYYSYQDIKLPSARERWVRRLLRYDPNETGDPRFSRPGRVLDIGCGSGTYLYKMKLAGWEVHGVEISRKAAELGNSKYGLQIQAGSLAQAKFQDDYFDYVRLNHSFEHVSTPVQYLELIRRYLAPEGLLFIGVPNVDSVPAKLFGKHWWNLGPPVHPFNYSKLTLVRLLEGQGYEVVSYRTNSSFAGYLGSLQMRLNDQKGVRSDDGRLLRFGVAKILAQWLSKLIDLFEGGDCLEIVARKRRPKGQSHA